MDKNYDVRIKKADKFDIRFLFNLRNQSDVYKYFKSPKKVEYEGHIKWIRSRINNQRQDIYLYVILCDNKKVGQVRFDLSEEMVKVAEISISVLSKYREKRIASSALKQGIEKIKKKGIEKIIAEIHINNIPSLNFFKNFGFIETKQEGEYKIFDYELKKYFTSKCP